MTKEKIRKKMPDDAKSESGLLLLRLQTISVADEWRKRVHDPSR